MVGGEVRVIEVRELDCYREDFGFKQTFNKRWMKKGKNRRKNLESNGVPQQVGKLKE